MPGTDDRAREAHEVKRDKELYWLRERPDIIKASKGPRVAAMVAKILTRRVNLRSMQQQESMQQPEYGRQTKYTVIKATMSSARPKRGRLGSRSML